MLVRRGGERLLFDCGEGTQRQLLRSDVGLVDLHEVFLTHFHADHFLGLPGMLKTFALRGRELPLTIYGPRGLDDLLQSLQRIFGRLTYEVAVVELAAGASLPHDGYELRTFPVRHGRDALGYALVEEERPGRFDVATADTLGVPFGPERGALQDGEAVTLADGRVVTPDEVLGAARPGRKLVLTGDTAPSDDRRRGGRSVPTCSSTRRRSARTRRSVHRRPSTRRRSRRPASRATPASSCSRSLTFRAATAAARSSARLAPSSRTRSCPATSTSSRFRSRSGAVPSW